MLILFYFLLREKDGVVHIHRMNTNGTVGSRIDTRDWTKGWTQAKPFSVGENSFLFLLKKATGQVHIHKIIHGCRSFRYQLFCRRRSTECFLTARKKHRIEPDTRFGHLVHLGAFIFYNII